MLHTLGVSATRAGVIRVAATHGEVTAKLLMDELHVRRATLIPHTKALVSAGVFTQHTDPAAAAARSGFNRLVWRVDVTVLREYLAQLEASLIPPAGA